MGGEREAWVYYGFYLNDDRDEDPDILEFIRKNYKRFSNSETVLQKVEDLETLHADEETDYCEIVDTSCEFYKFLSKQKYTIRDYDYSVVIDYCTREHSIAWCYDDLVLGIGICKGPNISREYENWIIGGLYFEFDNYIRHVIGREPCDFTEINAEE